MSRKETSRSAERTAPVGVRDGIPDRSERLSRWKYLVLAGVFVAWLGFLVYCAVAGGP